MKHGLASTYTNKGCRCPLCKKARADYMRERYEAMRKLGLCTRCGTPTNKALCGGDKCMREVK